MTSFSRIVAVGNGDENEIIYSDNSGVSQNGLGIIFNNRCYDVTYNEILDRWLVVGQGNNWAYYSSDGITWEEITSSYSGLARGYTVATNGNRWVFVGRGTFDKNRTIVYSDNGITDWQNVENSRTDIFTGSLGEGLDVACNGNNWVAVGKGNAPHRICYSTDNAVTWTHSLMVDGGNTDTLFTSRGNTVTTNGSRWIAGGFGTNTGGYMLLGYSDNNGQTWSKVTDPVIDTFNEIYGSHWDGNRFWIGGTGSNIKLAYSYNGLNWTFFENPGAYFLKPRGFLSYDSVLIMGGDTLGLYLSAISLDNGNNFSSEIRIDKFFTGTGKTIHSFACKFTPPPPEPPPVPPVANFAKGVSMPLKIGVSDSQSTFFLGRKAFLKNINESHRPENSEKIQIIHHSKTKLVVMFLVNLLIVIVML